MRLHRKWLDIFPAGVGQLLDRGFVGISREHPKRMYSFFPAVVKDRTKGEGVGFRVTAHTHTHTCTCTHTRNPGTSNLSKGDVEDSAKQASDRYTCEVVYNRVKVFDILKGHLPIKFLPYITAGLCLLCMHTLTS